MVGEIGKRQALIDLLLMNVLFWSVWSLRFFDVSFIGALTMAAGILLTLLLLKWRGQTTAVIGAGPVADRRWLLRHSIQTAAYIGVTALVVGAAVRVLIGDPSVSSVLTQQPRGFWLFLLDVTLVTWVLIGFGEEFVFRGFILNRLIVLFGQSPQGLLAAALLQAIWFGAGHASQGISGMLITGAIGFVLAMVYLYPARRSLWPLVIAHASIDSVALSLNWLTTN